MTPRPATLQGLLRGLLLPAVAAIGCAGTSLAQSTLVKDSPFGAAGVAGLAANAPAEAYELAGSSVEGKDVSVCIFERQAKRSQWISVGADADGIRVVSYDPSNDTAVVMIAGSRKELAMRTAAVAATGPVSSVRVAQAAPPPEAPSAQIASAPVPAVGTPAHEQREARMLVSDLLEIGIQQRKAYQEAKQRAAAAGAQPAPDN